MHRQKPRPEQKLETNEEKASRLIRELLGNAERMQKYGQLILFLQEKSANGTLGTNGWGKEFSRLYRIRDDTWEMEDKKRGFGGQDSASSVPSAAPQSSGWEKAMQFVKSMVCDPAQFEKLARSAHYEDEKALRDLKNEFGAAKGSGKKVEKSPEEWLAAKELVERAKAGKKPQPQARSPFYEKPKAEPARTATTEQEKAARLEKDARELLASGLLDRLEAENVRKFLDYGNKTELLSYGWASTIEKYAANVAQRKEQQQKQKDSLLDRCRKLKESDNIMLDEEDEAEWLESRIKMGIDLAGSEKRLAELERVVAARSAKFDVDSAIKELLKPEYERYMIECMGSVKDIYEKRSRGIKMAEDWVRDVVVKAHEDLKNIKESLAREQPGSPRIKLIKRVQDVLFSGMNLGPDKVELKAALYNLLRIGVDWGGLQFLEKMLERHEQGFIIRQMELLLAKIDEAQVKPLAGAEKAFLSMKAESLREYIEDIPDEPAERLNAYAVGIKGIEEALHPILEKAAQPKQSEQGRQPMTTAELNERIETLADAISDADEAINGKVKKTARNFNKFDGLIFRLGQQVNRSGNGSSPAPQKALEKVAEIEKDARELLEKHGLELMEG